MIVYNIYQEKKNIKNMIINSHRLQLKESDEMLSDFDGSLKNVFEKM